MKWHHSFLIILIDLFRNYFRQLRMESAPRIIEALYDAEGGLQDGREGGMSDGESGI
jgi:hypothetical protein